MEDKDVTEKRESSVDLRTPANEYYTSRDIGEIKKKHIPLLEKAFAKYPSLWDWHKKFKRPHIKAIKQLEYTILGDMLEFLESTRLRDLTEEKKTEFESFFAKFYASKLRASAVALQKAFVDHISIQRQMIVGKKGIAGVSKARPTFVQFVLEPTWQVYQVASEDNGNKRMLENGIKSFNLSVPSRELQNKDPKVLDDEIDHDVIAEACDLRPEAPCVAFVSKMLAVPVKMLSQRGSHVEILNNDSDEREVSPPLLSYSSSSEYVEKTTPIGRMCCLCAGYEASTFSKNMKENAKKDYQKCIEPEKLTEPKNNSISKAPESKKLEHVHRTSPTSQSSSPMSIAPGTISTQTSCNGKVYLRNIQISGHNHVKLCCTSCSFFKVMPSGHDLDMTIETSTDSPKQWEDSFQEKSKDSKIKQQLDTLNSRVDSSDLAEDKKAELQSMVDVLETLGFSIQ
ncbi:hypothetical protein L6164_008591 [Bauhinia variegata]|uniref:Uncharacterized protein n=1 Tax=Bauhinia variegata TaxID=167791 RepID=A0ACB9PMR0_BAUVA|nr:hypothetical protein L6164_008591 [Bauhinia variegata]